MAFDSVCAMTEQLSLFSETYGVRFTSPQQTQDWPLPAASTLDEAVDAARGLGVFLAFTQGIFWGPDWDSDTATSFSGFDPDGKAVRLEISTQYTGWQGGTV